VRRALIERCWTLATWLAARRKAKVLPEDLARSDYRGQTRGMGLRMREALRDKLRPRWLKVIQNDEEDAS
jgi:hypothetical protein